MKLLTLGNPKTVKGAALGYWTAILHFAPGELSGYQVCPMAKLNKCLAPCLNLAGHGGLMAGVSRLTLAMVSAGKMNHVQAARIRRTKMFFETRDAFMAKLIAEIYLFIGRAKRAGFRPAIRPNGTSDIRWERVTVTPAAIALLSKALRKRFRRFAKSGAPNVMALFPRVPFYDYTKLPNRRDLPANYSLTFSLGAANEPQAFAALAAGMNVAVVFRHQRLIPPSFMGAPVIDGDAHDLRFLDRKGCVVGLYAKGPGKTDSSGFVRDVPEPTALKLAA